jgi:hypothetical protein
LLSYSSTLKMEVTYTSEISGCLQTTWCYMLEHHTLHRHHHKSPKYDIGDMYWWDIICCPGEQYSVIWPKVWSSPVNCVSQILNNQRECLVTVWPVFTLYFLGGGGIILTVYPLITQNLFSEFSKKSKFYFQWWVICLMRFLHCKL